MSVAHYTGSLEQFRGDCPPDVWAALVLSAAESYERQTLKNNPAILDRVLMACDSSAAQEMRTRINQVFDLSEEVSNTSKPLPADDDSACRNLLLFAWPESGQFAFMAVTNAELLRHRSTSPPVVDQRTVALGFGRDRPGNGHWHMFDNRHLACVTVEHLYTFYGHRDPYAWPVWGLSPTGNYWSVNGRSFGEALRTD